MEQKELKQNAKLYLENKTFIYIIEKFPSGEIKWYHGYIIKIHDDFLVLQDRKIIQPFPILFESIVKLEPSEANID